MAVSLTVKGHERSLNLEGHTPLLGVVRYELGVESTRLGGGGGGGRG